MPLHLSRTRLLCCLSRWYRQREAFSSEVQARYFNGFRVVMENIHSETYSLLIDTYIKDPIQHDYLFDAMKLVSLVSNGKPIAMRWIVDQRSTFVECLVAFAAVEGIFFSGSFVSVCLYSG
jgi:ribonucleoside-diphosphate reductase subunit M2